jgi:hypothetical protein
VQYRNIRVAASTGVPRLDRLIAREQARLRAEFRVNPTVYIYDDHGRPNALASSRSSRYGRTGTIYFGRTLMVRELYQGPYRVTAVVGIMAHEYSHILQMIRGDARGNRIVLLELHADCMAGWYLRRTRGANLDIQPFARSLFDKGDYAYWNRNHHGTPRQRMFAMAAGANAWELVRDQAYTYCFSVARRVPQTTR